MKYLHHDHTPFFTSTLEAKHGEKVTVRLRAPKDTPITEARLVILDVGDLRNFVMKSVKTSSSDWQFFEVEMPLVNPTTRYVFVAQTKDDSVILSTRGARRFMPPFRDWFQYATGRKNATWLEDRVFYQIFPDRFKDAEPNISVMNGEYNYEGIRVDAAGELEFYDRDVVKRNWDELPSRATNVLEHFGGDLLGITKELDTSRTWVRTRFTSTRFSPRHQITATTPKTFSRWTRTWVANQHCETSWMRRMPKA
jgi:alpha-glucosidase